MPVIEMYVQSGNLAEVHNSICKFIKNTHSVGKDNVLGEIICLIQQYCDDAEEGIVVI